MKRKVIFLDVDGTIISPEGDVSHKVKEAIQKSRENGHYVFLCTGRSRVGIESLTTIGFDGYICSAGSYIEVNGQCLYEFSLPPEDVQLARDVFERNHILYNLETTHMTFQNEEMSKEFVKHQVSDQDMNSELARLINEQKNRFNVHTLEDFEKSHLSVKKICFIAFHESDLEEPKALLSSKYNFIVHELFSSHTINGEIIIKETNKGTAVEKVVDALGLHKDDTICFGDSMNDLEMVQACHYSVVMDNGSEQLKPYADKICESVADDGVAHEMKRLNLY